jgi:hypothetical protein
VGLQEKHFFYHEGREEQKKKEKRKVLVSFVVRPDFLHCGQTRWSRKNLQAAAGGNEKTTTCTTWPVGGAAFCEADKPER